MYPSTVTPAEAELGFSVITAKTDYATIVGTPETIQIVVKVVSAQDRVWKIEEDGYQDQHLRAGADPDFLSSWALTEDTVFTLNEIAARG